MSDSMLLNSEEAEEYISVEINAQTFGLPILRVQDVFKPDYITPVPLSIREVAGITNLRGRIVTLIDMRKRLGLPILLEATKRIMCVGIECKHETYGLIIDRVGEVLRLDKANIEKNPSNLNPCWKELSAGVFKLEKELMVLLDVGKILEMETLECAVAC